MAQTSDPPSLTDAQKRVLAAAIEVFAERGFAAASTAEIAKRANVAEGTIFKQFKTKKELLYGVVTPVFVRMVGPLIVRGVGTLLTDPYPSLAVFLHHLAHNRMEFVRGHSALLRILVQEVPFQPELRERIKTEVIDKLLPTGTQLIQRFKDLGEIDPSLPNRTVIRTLVGMLASLLADRMLNAPEEQWADPAEIEIFVRVTCNALAPRPQKESSRA